MNKNATEDFHRYPVNASRKKETSMEAVVEFKHPLFKLERNSKHNGRVFTRYPVNASENGDFNRGLKSFQANTMFKILTRATEKKLKGHGPT